MNHNHENLRRVPYKHEVAGSSPALPIPSSNQQLSTEDANQAKESAYTPGPWKLIDSGVVVAGEGIVVAVAEVCDMQVPQEAESNARLIAAAPDLLAALERAIPYLQSHCAMTSGDVRGMDGSFGDRVALDRAEEAIRKAKGEL